MTGKITACTPRRPLTPQVTLDGRQRHFGSQVHRGTCSSEIYRPSPAPATVQGIADLRGSVPERKE